MPADQEDPSPGQDQHLHVVTKLKLLQNAEHLPVELRAHAVPLVRAVEVYPGNSILHIVADGFFLGPGIGLGQHVGRFWSLSSERYWR